MIPIIIVNWNGLEDTIECIDSVLKLDHKDFQIHLIDNHSEASQRIDLKKKFGDISKIHLHFYERNYGFTKAHLKIWEELLIQQDVQYIALLNNDTVVDANWLLALEKLAKNSAASMVSSKMIDYYDRSKMDSAGHQMLSSGEMLPIGHKNPVGNFELPFNNFGPSAGAALYDKKCLEKIGFFDPHFHTGYEDAELGFRAYILGHNLMYCPKAIVYHKGGRSIKKVFNEKYAIDNQKNILYTIFKLYPSALLLVYYPIILLKALFMIMVFIILLKWKYAKIIAKSHFLFLKNDLQLSLKARKRFHQNNHLLNWWKIRSAQKSFIAFDLKRAFAFLVLRKPSALDQYG